MTSPAIGPRTVALVAAGGAAGTLSRWGVLHVVPGGALPWATLTVNLLGSFALGFLLERLSRPGPRPERITALRLLLGTGFLGGFTTFSTVALELWDQLSGAHLSMSLLYAGVSLTGGVLAAWLGVLTAVAHGSGTVREQPRHHREHRDRRTP